MINVEGKAIGDAVGPFALAYVVYRLGLHAYRRQKEQEMLVERYLVGGVDQVASHSQHMLAVFRHNWAEGLALLRMMTQMGTSMRSEDFASRFTTLDAGTLDVRAHYRLNAIIGDMVFYHAHQDAVVLVGYATSYFRDDLAQAAHMLASGRKPAGDLERAFGPRIEALNELAAPHYQLLAQLQRIAEELESMTLDRRSLRMFRERPEVRAALAAAQRVQAELTGESIADRLRTLESRIGGPAN